MEFPEGMPTEMEISPVTRTAAANPDQTFQTLMQRGDFQRAASLQRTQLETDPEDHQARLGLAEALRHSGDLAGANAEFLQLAEIVEWRTQGLMGMARIALASQQYGVAARTFASLTEENPDLWRAWLGLAQARDHMGNWANADIAYAQALLASSAPAIVHNNHGVSLLARGDSFAAAEAFRVALEIDPGFEAAATNMDLALATAGGALTPDQAGGDAIETARRLNNFGYAAMLQGRKDEALSYFDAALSAHPSFYAKAYENRATAKGDS